MAKARSEQYPWWPLIPLWWLVAVVVILLALIALLSILYFWLYPDRHAHLYDCEGTPHQRARLAQWRAAYRRLRPLGRIGRAVASRCDEE
jgi:hypothetical protein